jgi:hypothetical protein
MAIQTICQGRQDCNSTLHWLHVLKLEGKANPRFKHWSGTNPKFIEHLRTREEAGTVNLKDKSTSKVADHGIQCMMIGYLTDHTSNCYEMWDPSTGGIHTTWDIIWLKRMHFPKVTIGPSTEGDNIQVQHSNLKVWEGISTNDSKIEVVTIHKEEDKDLSESQIKTKTMTKSLKLKH